MKTKKNTNNIKAFLLISILIILSRLIGSLPWWSFVLPVMITGLLTSLKGWKVSCFRVGFLSGFMIWFGANLFFDAIYHGKIMEKLGELLLMNKPAVFIISGLVGGLLSGLAMYTGEKIIFSEIQIKLDETETGDN